MPRMAPIEYTFALGFLDAGTYELALIEQGDSPDTFERSVQSVEGGGFGDEYATRERWLRCDPYSEVIAERWG